MSRKLLSVLLSCFLGVSLMACGNGNSGVGGKTPDDNGNNNGIPVINTERPVNYKPSQTETVNSLSATDGYGRSFTTVDSMDSKKKVGIFYFLWMGNHGSASVDISKTDLAALQGNSSIGVHHYWGEPLYGYYHSEDEWVMRKHIELFIAAGIDYLCIDTTNGVVWSGGADYRKAIRALLDTLLEIREQGLNVPQVMFYTNADSERDVKILYDNFYDKSNPELSKYEPLWFNYEDTARANRAKKPWIAANDDFKKLPQEVQERFYRKDAQWPNDYAADGNFDYKPNGMPWMSWAGPKENYEQHNHNGIMSVSIAQHVSGAFSDSVMEGDRNLNYGRGFSRSDGVNKDARVNLGSNFQEQWDYALMQGDEVNNIFITGWNEWVAQKQPAELRDTCYFVDCYNIEFSRDAEMMKGGYGDAFYLQIADNIRKFKGLNAPGARVNPWSAAIDVNGGIEQWDGTRGFIDIAGDTAKRNYKSANFSLPNYTDESGRNDITSVNFTYDGYNVYFLVACANDITQYNGEANWMNILLNVSGTEGESWANYHYVINRSVFGSASSVERLKADGSGEKAGEAKICVNGKYLAVSIPRAAIGLNSSTFEIGFKVADNVTNYTDIYDYYVTGDCAPMGRLNYTVKVRG